MEVNSIPSGWGADADLELKLNECKKLGKLLGVKWARITALEYRLHCQCLSMCTRMLHRRSAKNHPECALHDLGGSGGEIEAGGTPTGTYMTGVSEQP